MTQPAIPGRAIEFSAAIVASESRGSLEGYINIAAMVLRLAWRDEYKIGIFTQPEQPELFATSKQLPHTVRRLSFDLVTDHLTPLLVMHQINAEQITSVHGLLNRSHATLDVVHAIPNGTSVQKRLLLPYLVTLECSTQTPNLPGVTWGTMAAARQTAQYSPSRHHSPALTMLHRMQNLGQTTSQQL